MYYKTPWEAIYFLGCFICFYRHLTYFTTFRKLESKLLTKEFFMNEISAKYFSTKFIIDNKLKLADIVILEYIYSWILSNNPPEFKMESGKKAFYLSQSHIANDYNSLIDQSTISRKMKKLERCGIVETRIIDSVKGKFYLCFNWDKVIESLAPQELLEQQRYKYCSNWFEKIFQYMQEEKKTKQKWDEEWNKKSWHEKIQYEMQQEQEWKKEQANSYNNNEVNKVDTLLDKKDMNIKVSYSKQADMIAKRILIKYPNVFVNKIPKEGEKPTKTYISICHKIDDIYNGRFTSFRFYQFDECVFKNKQFDTENWRENIVAVKGDWNKVKSLIYTAIKNYILMFQEDRMPFKKDWLTNNLNEWFHSENPNTRNQSQFIQSLKEPQIQKSKLGNDKAKSIVDNLKEKSPIAYEAGHELNQLLPLKASELSAWTFITDIIKWGKLLWQFDENAKYFMQCKINGELHSGPKVLPAIFARWLKEKNIAVNLSTLDIKQSSASNSPWCWFYHEACRKHDMNYEFVNCFDSTDFYDARKMSGKITFDDMNELPVF